MVPFGEGSSIGGDVVSIFFWLSKASTWVTSWGNYVINISHACNRRVDMSSFVALQGRGERGREGSNGVQKNMQEEDY